VSYSDFLSHLGGSYAHLVTQMSGFSLFRWRQANEPGRQKRPEGSVNRMSILWIILIVVLVLALLGFFSRGYW
jgi:hypothetical protein